MGVKLGRQNYHRAMLSCGAYQQFVQAWSPETMQILESLNVNDRVRFSGKVEVLWLMMETAMLLLNLCLC